MTEAEWASCVDPERMLDFLAGGTSKRKLRLLACACCRRIWQLLDDASARRAVEVAERYTDGEVGDVEWGNVYFELCGQVDAMEEGGPTVELRAAKAALATVVDFRSTEFLWLIKLGLRSAAMAVATASGEFARHPYDQDHFERLMASAGAEEVVALRDVFANPFHPVAVDPLWLTPAVVTLAQAIYDERAFDRMPRLADALERAGCSNAAVLAHCRSPGPHVRGCWVIDLVLGKH